MLRSVIQQPQPQPEELSQPQLLQPELQPQPLLPQNSRRMIRMMIQLPLPPKQEF